MNLSPGILHRAFQELKGKISPNALAFSLIVLAITLAYFQHSRKSKPTTDLSPPPKGKNQTSSQMSTQPAHRDIFSLLRKGGGTSKSLQSGKAKAPSDKPFGSSYYYAHNNPNAKGGYKDGLRTEDYVMNKPRLLSRNGMCVDDDNYDTPEHQDAVEESLATENNNVSASTPPSPETNATTQSQQQEQVIIPPSSLPLMKYGWEDTPNTAKIRIDSLPDGKNGTVSWDNASIPKSGIRVATLFGSDNRGLLLLLVDETSNQHYHLRVPRMYAAATAVSTVWKMKRLIVKVDKKVKDRSWPRLSVAPEVDAGLFKKHEGR